MKRQPKNNQNITTKLTFCFVWTIVVATFAVSANAQNGNQFLTETDNELTLTGHFQLEESTRTGYLVLTAKIPEGSYIYSLTQKGNPPPSKIEVATSEAFKVSGTFKPELQPTVNDNDPDFGGRTEKHKKSLRFFIPLQLTETANAEDLTIKLRFNGQICSEEGTCMPVKDKIVQADFSGYFQRVAERNENSGTLRR